MIIVSVKATSPILVPARICAAWGDWLMLSCPPATTISASPAWIAWPAIATARRPEPQTWLMVSAVFFLRHAGGHRGLSGRVLAGIGGKNLPHDHVVDIRAGDVRAFHGRFDGDPAEIGGRHRGEGAAEGADRGGGRRWR